MVYSFIAGQLTRFSVISVNITLSITVKSKLIYLKTLKSLQTQQLYTRVLYNFYISVGNLEHAQMFQKYFGAIS